MVRTQGGLAGRRPPRRDRGHRFVDNLLRHEPQIDNPSHPAVIAIQTGKPVRLDDITADVLDAATDAPATTPGGRVCSGRFGGRRTDHGEPRSVGCNVARAARASSAALRFRRSLDRGRHRRTSRRSIQAGAHPSGGPQRLRQHPAGAPAGTVAHSVRRIRLRCLPASPKAATVIGGDWYAVVPIDDTRLAIAYRRRSR